MLSRFFTRTQRSILCGEPEFIRNQMIDVSVNKMLPMEAETEALVYMLARTRFAKYAVDFGSPFNVSALWLAAAVKDNGGGRVITSMDAPLKTYEANQIARSAGLGSILKTVEGSPLNNLKESESGINFVLCDCATKLTEEWVRTVIPKLAPGAVLFTNKVQKYNSNVNSYFRLLGENNFCSHTIPSKYGAHISIWQG